MEKGRLLEGWGYWYRGPAAAAELAGGWAVAYEAAAESGARAER